MLPKPFSFKKSNVRYFFEERLFSTIWISVGRLWLLYTSGFAPDSIILCISQPPYLDKKKPFLKTNESLSWNYQTVGFVVYENRADNLHTYRLTSCYLSKKSKNYLYLTTMLLNETNICLSSILHFKEIKIHL